MGIVKRGDVEFDSLVKYRRVERRGGLFSVSRNKKVGMRRSMREFVGNVESRIKFLLNFGLIRVFVKGEIVELDFLKIVKMFVLKDFC